MTSATRVAPARPARSSPLVAAAVATVALFAASLVLGLVRGGRAYSSPFGDDAALRDYLLDHRTAVAVTAVLQTGSALALGVLTGLLWARLRATGPGPAAVAAVGGTLAATLLGLNAMVLWAAADESVAADPALTRALTRLFFVLGGPGHVAALGLLVAGTVTAAGRSLPGWYTRTSLAVAVVCVLSLLTLVTESATTLIPVGRFLTLAWLVGTGLLLGQDRPAREG